LGAKPDGYESIRLSLICNIILTGDSDMSRLFISLPPLLLVTFFLVGYSQAGAPGSTDGLTFEEYLSFTPPAPPKPRADVGKGGVDLTWQEPVLPGGVKPAYDPRVEAYRVFRREPGGLRKQIGETENTFFTDSSAKTGKSYLYSIKALQHSGHESNYSPETSITLF
jgi:hypothetical protein